MASGNKVSDFGVTDFSGGLNSIMSATKVKDSESPRLQDVEFTENGLPGKRRGTSAYGDAPGSRVLGMGRLYTAAGTRRHLMVSGTSLYYYNSGTWTAISGKTFTAGSRANFVQVRDAVYIHNGSDSMGKYDGTTLSTPTTGVTGKFGIYYDGRHVVSGVSSFPSRVYFSSDNNADNFTGLSGTATSATSTTLTDSGKSWNTNEFAGLVVTVTAGTGVGQERLIVSNTSTALTVGTAWTTTPDSTSQYLINGGDSIDISKDDGQKVTGLAKFEEKLIIFKERSTYSLTFDSSRNPVVELVSAAYGCVSHRSIETVENDVFFLAQDGVRTLGYVPNIPGVLRTGLLTSKVQSETDNVNPLQYEACAAIYHKNHYLLAFPQGVSSTNSRILAFNVLYGAWSVWTGLAAACFNEFVDSTDNQERLYYGSDTSGQAYEMFSDGYDDEGAAIDSYWYSKQFDLGNPAVEKDLVYVDVQVRSLTGTLGIDVIADGESSTAMVSLTSSFSGDDGYRSGSAYRGTQTYRQSNGATADLVATDDVRRIWIKRPCRTVQVKAYNSAVGESFVLMGIWVRAFPRSRYKFDVAKSTYT